MTLIKEPSKTFSKSDLMLSNSDQDMNVIECRICHSKTTRDLILSPCLCKGSMAYVHFSCLERWLNCSSRDTCELCSSRFNVVLTRKYSFRQSIRVWISHPANRTFIMCDLIIGLALTALTLTLVSVCFIGLNRFVEENHAFGIHSVWSEGVIDLFLIILMTGYLITMYSMIRDHLRPWYAWWTHCHNVRLVLDKTTVQAVSTPTQTLKLKNLSSKRSSSRHELNVESVSVPMIHKNIGTANFRPSKSNPVIHQNLSIIGCHQHFDTEVEITNINAVGSCES